jgi:DNA modification methylase
MKRVLKLVEDESTERVVRKSEAQLWSGDRAQFHPMHYIVSYPKSFKPELASFAIEKFSEPGQIVFDPFCGRGTSVLQANLMGRVAYFSDAHPLAVRMTQAKTNPVGLEEVVLRLQWIDFRKPTDVGGYKEFFEPFYHPDTFREICALKAATKNSNDPVLKFIELITLSRLHGHAHGYFSAYTFPHVALSPEMQREMNTRRREVPEHRPIAPRILRRTAQALRDGFTRSFYDTSSQNRSSVQDARSLSNFSSNTVDLVVTAPPKIDEANMLDDQWMELWFSGIRSDELNTISRIQNEDEWNIFMEDSLEELLRVTKPRGHAVIDLREDPVGEFEDRLVAIAERIRKDHKRFVVEEVLVHKPQQQGVSSRIIRANSENQSQDVHTLVVLKCLSR